MALSTFQQGWLDRGKELNAIYDALTTVFGCTETHDAAADIALLGEERDHYRDLLQRILDSYDDGTINVPEVDRAVEEEIRAALSRTGRPTEDS